MVDAGVKIVLLGITPIVRITRTSVKPDPGYPTVMTTSVGRPSAWNGYGLLFPEKWSLRLILMNLPVCCRNWSIINAGGTNSTEWRMLVAGIIAFQKTHAFLLPEEILKARLRRERNQRKRDWNCQEVLLKRAFNVWLAAKVKPFDSNWKVVEVGRLPRRLLLGGLKLDFELYRLAIESASFAAQLASRPLFTRDAVQH